MIKIGKYICNDCGAKLRSGEILVAPNPFKIDEDVFGCPKCKAVEGFWLTCDRPECWKKSTCRLPLLEGHTNLCRKHEPYNF